MKSYKLLNIYEIFSDQIDIASTDHSIVGIIFNEAKLIFPKCELRENNDGKLPNGEKYLYSIVGIEKNRNRALKWHLLKMLGEMGWKIIATEGSIFLRYDED